MIKCLLAKGAGINHVDDKGWTVIHYATKYGQKEITEFLVNAGAALSPKESIEGKTPLMLAAQYGKRETLKHLLKLNVDVNDRSKKDGCTALMLACKGGYKNIARDLLDNGADSFAFDGIGWSALHYAACTGKVETASIILATGVDVDHMEREESKAGGTPFTVATRFGHLEMMKFLMLRGAEVNRKDMHRGMSAIAIAARNGSTPLLDCLLQCRADLNSRDLKEMTPLMHAASCGHHACIVSLLNCFAEIDFRDEDGKSAMWHAVDHGAQDVFLAAVLELSPEAKVVIIPWLEMEALRMQRGSGFQHGAAGEYFFKMLYGAPQAPKIVRANGGILDGLKGRTPDMDTYLVGSLVYLAAAMVHTAKVQWQDREKLLLMVEELQAMAVECLNSHALLADELIANCLLLGDPVPRGHLTPQLLYNAFNTGPLALSIDSNLTRIHGCSQVSSLVQLCLWSMDPRCDTVPVSGVQLPRRWWRLRYCPAAMIFLEAFGKLLFLGVVCLVAKSYDPTVRLLSSQSLLLLFVMLNLLYECGLVLEKRWAVCPSLYLDYSQLESKRWAAVCSHFVDDPWKSIDVLTLLLLILWRGSMSGLGKETAIYYLAVAPIPLTIGLLRYFIIWFPDSLGRLILTVALTARMLAGYLIIYAFMGFSFAVALSTVYGYQLSEYSSTAACARTLFTSMFMHFDLNVFDSQPHAIYGRTVLAVFVVCTAVVVFCAMVASTVHSFPALQNRAMEHAMHWKAMQVKLNLLCVERSPFCMLPVPFNIVPALFYVPHEHYLRNARQKSDNLYVLSVAGTVCDRLLGVVFAPLAAIIEYSWVIYTSPQRANVKAMLVLSAPVGISSYAVSMILAAVRHPPTQLLTTSRLERGRLKIRYQDSRDDVEVVGLVEDPMGAEGGGSLATPSVKRNIFDGPLLQTVALETNGRDSGDDATKKLKQELSGNAHLSSNRHFSLSDAKISPSEDQKDIELDLNFDRAPSSNQIGPVTLNHREDSCRGNDTQDPDQFTENAYAGTSLEGPLEDDYESQDGEPRTRGTLLESSQANFSLEQQSVIIGEGQAVAVAAYQSALFPRNKYPQLFNKFERRRIFQNVDFGD